MISPVSNVVQTQAPAQATAANQKQPVPKPQPAATDTIQISNASKVALQELMETSAQTTREASTGDRQTQRLLAREAAAKTQ